jgi:hypothetical protein
LIPFLLLPEFSIVEMVGILVDGNLHAPPGVQDFKLVVDEDMPIVAPIRAAPALRLGVEDAKFKRNLAVIDSQELFRKVAGGFVCHTVFFCAKKHFQPARSWQSSMNVLPGYSSKRHSRLDRESIDKCSRNDPCFYKEG